MPKKSKQNEQKVSRDIWNDVIVPELKEGKIDTGRPLAMSSETYHQFMGLVRFGVSPHRAARSIKISHSAISQYKKASETFQTELEAAEENLPIRSQVVIAQQIVGTPDRKAKTLDAQGNLVEIEIEGIKPNPEFAWRYSEKKSKEDGELPPDGQTNLTIPTPKNEEEARLINLMLKGFQEYDDEATK